MGKQLANTDAIIVISIQLYKQQKRVPLGENSGIQYLKLKDGI